MLVLLDLAETTIVERGAAGWLVSARVNGRRIVAPGETVDEACQAVLDEAARPAPVEPKEGWRRC
jgi:hypothetical protein